MKPAPTQRPLFCGLDLLPGQQDLFPTDGPAEPTTALWTFTSPSRSPNQIAEIFAQEFFGEPRQVAHFDGKWVGLNFSGEFSLINGTRFYRIICDQWGHYTVS